MANRRVDFAGFQQAHSLLAQPTLHFKEGVAAVAGRWVEAVGPLMATAPIMQPQTEDNGGEVWITAIVDGEHKKTSRHFSGDALDVRCMGERPGAIWYGDYAAGEMELGRPDPRRQTELARLWGMRLRRALGPDWDVVVEARHIHLEYDPK